MSSGRGAGQRRGPSSPPSGATCALHGLCGCCPSWSGPSADGARSGGRGSLSRVSHQTLLTRTKSPSGEARLFRSGKPPCDHRQGPRRTERHSAEASPKRRTRPEATPALFCPVPSTEHPEAGKQLILQPSGPTPKRGAAPSRGPSRKHTPHAPGTETEAVGGGAEPESEHDHSQIAAKLYTDFWISG